MSNKTDPRPSDSPPATGSAVPWEHYVSSGVKIWTWAAERGVKYMVTALADNIQAHITTGTVYKFTRSIGRDFATAEDAQAACVQHRQSEKLRD